MVTVTNGAWSLDIRQIDFSSMFNGAYYQYSSTRLRVHLYADYIDDFEGTGFKFDFKHLDPHHPFFHAPIAGTLTSYSQPDFEFRMAGMHLEMTDVVAVAKTISTTDDALLIQHAMDGQDTFQGRVGDSYMATYGGHDVLIGGGGSDVLYGGTGAGMFIYKLTNNSTTDRYDTLMDFSLRDHDKIDLSAIDANGKGRGDAAFDFIGAHQLGHHAGELHVFYDKYYTYLGGDVNGDGKDDLLIALHGTVHLTRQAFEL